MDAERQALEPLQSLRRSQSAQAPGEHPPGPDGPVLSLPDGGEGGGLGTAAVEGTASRERGTLVALPGREDLRSAPGDRPRVLGKFVFVGDEKLLIRGVTYGTFRPNEDGSEFVPERVERDFAAMTRAGINAVRLYTPPPRWLLNAARRHRLYVMVGLPWEQHVAFLDDGRQADSIIERVRAEVRRCAGHPAVLCYAIGNEIPAGIARWHGRRRVERFLARLCGVAKEEDPGGLVTYVNFPSTEYLEVPLADIVSFNVYLEAKQTLESYLARLQNLAGERPLVLAEIGLDSRRNGEDGQARALAWQVESAFSSACAGAFVFAWTDEWHRGGFDIDDWDFGLTDREGRPKPALAAVAEAFARAPAPAGIRWPSVSVIVCTHNGARTIDECLAGIERLDYPTYEVIVVDDGSRDETAAVARRRRARVISTENLGLAAARNTGLEAADGEIVAYIDDDACPDPDWLRFIALELASGQSVAVGGPNLAPPGCGQVADCVANAPGGPIHVLLTDRVAEHVPGCNMAFRRDALKRIGGFDPRFRAAGDDVDVCWRVQQAGGTIAFAPGAIVWHRRRDSIRGFWRQQRGYGKSEGLLERKWPEKYNRLGHLRWSGRLYGKGIATGLRLRRARVHHGTWGTRPFQSVYEPSDGTVGSLALMPEWYLLIVGLLGVGVLGAVWSSLLLALPLAALAGAAVIARAVASAAAASFTSVTSSRRQRLKLRAITAVLHLIQPAARLRGRLDHGLTPWRHRAPCPVTIPLPATQRLWSEVWASVEERLQALEETVRAGGITVRRGGECDRWDLELHGGLMGCSRVRLVIEEHGAGRQLVRVRRWPRLSSLGVAGPSIAAAVALAAALGGAATDSAIAGAAGVAIGLRAAWEAAGASVGVDHAVREWAGASALTEVRARRGRLRRSASR